MQQKKFLEKEKKLNFNKNLKMKAICILLACAVLMSTLNYISADALNHENSKIDDEVGLKL